ncbi:PREDICTED: uncharacterized protein LOC107074068 [Polistes dominula]|uniref:Uncharacterized protein LOC107074068 n=1 Tax=Polistes dominula TaxID=743375 RepID=A0ABM1JEX7_POLDO|nr:PREDICTED: uncharacterized protein LOC107074068 [Polistes dominula]
MFTVLIFAILLWGKIINFVLSEEISSNSTSSFICTDGSQIPLINVCDGSLQCPDSSDETSILCRHTVCPSNMFRCSYGACINRTSRCNGIKNCVDGSDEIRCNLLSNETCSDREYQCSTPRLECIPIADICNGYVDCSDNSDEDISICREYSCPDYTYRCSYGGCVYQEVLCDGIKDCFDGSDEDTSMCRAINCSGIECLQHECGQNEFACENERQCVPINKICDGIRHCRDASDENSEMCTKQECRDDSYRCSYGACIPIKFTCNLRPDCYDWSDEDEELCGRVLPEGACRLPGAKPGIHYKIRGCSRCRPGEVVPEFTRLDYTCDNDGWLEGSNSVYCQNNRWLPSIPICSVGNNNTLRITCPPILEANGAIKRCESKWGPRKGWVSCEKPMPIAATLIVNGWEVQSEEYVPWHATLFSHENGQWKFFCGGTLIGERVILTAGHCVWKTFPETIRAAFGILSNTLNETLQVNAQVFEIDKIEIQNSYQDHEGNYGSDIALLILKIAVKINNVVRPVCVDLQSDLTLLEAWKNGDSGFVAGMGIMENDTYSSTLRMTSMKVISNEKCREFHHRDFRKYITYTSFCAGWANGTSVCNGDSGGGFILRRPNTMIWEVHGVVSISPRRLGTSICDPYSYTIFTKAFEVKTLKTGIMLSPGLSFTSFVIYSFRRPALLRAIIPIEINNKVLDYCVICTLITERISIKPMSIDFGIIDLGYTSEPKIITIYNEGGKTTRIKSTPNIRVPLKANVIAHRLIIYHENTTEDFTLVDFPPTVEKTCKYNTFVLRNISSRACNYVVLGEVNNELKPIRKIDHKKFPVYGAFEINPIEGRMDPFESIIFEIGIIKIHTEAINISGFDPIKETMIDETTSGKVHLQDKFWDLSSTLTSNSSIDKPVNNFVRICLYGEMEIIKLNLQPDSLYFGNLHIGEISQRVICITNSSKIESISFQCQPMPAVKCIPKSAKLKPEGSTEVLVKVQARENVGPSFVLLINATVDSENSTVSKCSTKVKIRTFRVICTLNVIFKTRTPMTQFVTGITPLITHEVGFMTNRATFGSNVKKPRQAMLFVEKDLKRSWANKKLIRDNVIIDSVPAYPNDTQKSLRPYRGPPVKTIFTGKPRYTLGPIQFEAFTGKQANTINKHRLYWADYLYMSQLSRKKMLGMSVAKLFPNDDNDNDVISRLTQVPKKFQELPLTFPCKKFADQKFHSKIHPKIFTTLSPLQIYNVYVHPAIINFGMVAWKTFSYRQLIASNSNEFSVKIQFLSTSTNIRFPEGDTIILQPNKILTKLVEFYGDRMGKFNSFINYNINDNHSFQMNAIAEIVHKNLLIDKREVFIGKDYLEDESYRPQWSIIQIKNKLDASTRYKWKTPEISCFSIEPKYGIIGGNSILNTFISYNADPLKPSSVEMIIKCESGTFSRLQCNLLYTIPKVTFVNDRTDLGDLSLNLPTKVHGILQNFEFTEVVYEIDSTSLIRGCEINQLNGIISPRGIAILEATLKFDVCIDFTVTIFVTIQKHLKLQWKITGRVPFPRLKFTPNFIEQRRVIADSFQSHLITISNIGTTLSKLQFALQDYPEFSVVFITNEKTDIKIEENTSVLIPSRSTMSFYLHFQPLDPASYVIYLPIVINDLLGPVLETDPKTFAPSEYIELQKEFYKDIQGITFLELPLKLPVISIDFTVAGRAVSFNKFTFVFDVATDNMIDELKIDNPDKLKEVTVIIKTDNFIKEDCPFCINWSRGIKPTITSTSITCLLLPGEEIVFSVEFKPIYRGTFKLEALIFIQRDSTDLPFNTINFNGVNAKEFIEANISEIYLLPQHPTSNWML